MDKDVLIASQERLDELKAAGLLKYVGEDWGQLDLYDTRPPVEFPCVLIDAAVVDYSDRGQRTQEGLGTLSVRYAEYDPVRISSGAPDNTRGFRCFDAMQQIYKALQGLSGDTFSGLTRIRMAKARRDDGIREYEITFRFAFVDNTAARKTQKVKVEPVIIN